MMRRIALGEAERAIQRMALRRCPDMLVFGFLFCAATAFTLFLYWPGGMTNDSCMQFAEAQRGRYGDGHPPIMAFIWRYLGMAIPGPGGMLLFHSLLYWGGLALLFSALRLPLSLRVMGFVVSGFFPPVFGLVGVIWKDVGMVVAAMMTCGLIMAYRRSRRAWLLLLALPALFYCVAVRHNAAPLAVPLSFWALTLAKRADLRLWRATAKYAVAACLVAAALMALSLAFAAAISVRNHAEQGIQIFDLAGTSVFLGKSLIPEGIVGPMVKVSPDLETIRQYYIPISHVYLTQPRYHDRKGTRPVFFVYSTDPQALAILARSWREAIWTHPIAYLRHRAAVFAASIGLLKERPQWPVMKLDVLSNPAQFPLNAAPLAWQLLGAFTWLSETPFYWIWLYIAILPLFALAGGLVAVRDGDAAVLALSSSGLLFAAMCFFVLPASDFRYYLWPIASCQLSVWIALESAALRKTAKTAVMRMRTSFHLRRKGGQ